MVVQTSSNRILTKVEVESELEKLDYEPEVLISFGKKYNIELKDDRMKWKKNQMDKFKTKIKNEHQELDDLFLINIKRNQELFKKKKELEISKRLFVCKDRLYNLEYKILKLKNVFSTLNLKTESIQKIITKIKETNT